MKSDEGIFKMLSKSSIIRNQYENVIPKLILKVLKTPEKSTSLAFFFIKGFNEGLNEVSTKVINNQLKEFPSAQI